MPFSSIGDLATSLIQSQSNILAKRNLQRFSTELTTGVTSDVKGVLRNDLAQQVHWRQDLASNGVLEETLSEALTRVEAKQLALNSINETATSLANDISTSLASRSGIAFGALSSIGGDELEHAVSLLNTQVAGKSVFSGTATDSAALAFADDILSAVKAYVGPSTTSVDIEQGVDNWINDTTSGFEAVAYLGSNDETSIRLSNNRVIYEESKANHPALKSLLKNLILVTIAGDETLGLDSSEKTSLLDTASNGIRTASAQMIELEADVGHVVSELQSARSSASAEIATIEQIRSNILGIDEFEVASKLQQAELQLEKIYTVTARSARMSLLEFLR